jgi:hypothetical protein
MREKTCPGPHHKIERVLPLSGENLTLYPRIYAHEIVYLGKRMNYIDKLNLAFDILS